LYPGPVDLIGGKQPAQQQVNNEINAVPDLKAITNLQPCANVVATAADFTMAYVFEKISVT
jgi:hypothetical protein